MQRIIISRTLFFVSIFILLSGCSADKEMNRVVQSIKRIDLTIKLMRTSPAMETMYHKFEITSQDEINHLLLRPHYELRESSLGGISGIIDCYGSDSLKVLSGYYNLRFKTLQVGTDRKKMTLNIDDNLAIILQRYEDSVKVLAGSEWVGDY